MKQNYKSSKTISVAVSMYEREEKRKYHLDSNSCCNVYIAYLVYNKLVDKAKGYNYGTVLIYNDVKSFYDKGRYICVLSFRRI